jgi:hypothetical protein
MQAKKKNKFVFGRNLYDTDETNSIPEIRLALYSPIFKVFVVVARLMLLLVSFCICRSADTRTKKL